MLKIELKPVSILTDFEVGCLNSFQTVFPGAERRGCYFHHTQCIWRKLQESPDILNNYNSDPDFALHVRQLGSLAFIPTPAVVSSFDILMATPFFNDHQRMLRPLTDYYQDTWIGSRRRGRRRAPLFPHSLWNCYQATADGISRTNNLVEGWHKRFSALLGGTHPTIWRFVDAIKEQSVTEMKINQLVAGNPSQPRRRKYRDLEQRLLSVVENYENNSVSEYLLGIAHNVKFQV